jgi:hypothetical protein
MYPHALFFPCLTYSPSHIQDPGREGGEEIKDFATTDQDSLVDRAHENNPND